MPYGAPALETHIEIGLGMKVAGLGFETGEVSAIDRESDRRSKNHAEDVLAANDVVITTTRAWEFVSRNCEISSRARSPSLGRRSNAACRRGGRKS